MLPRPTQRALRDALKRGLDPRYADPYVLVETQDERHPRANVSPRIEWRWQDEDQPDEPYTLVTLDITIGGIDEPEGVSDGGAGRALDVEKLHDATQDADVRITKGRPVRDELSIMVTAQGNQTFDGRLDRGISARDRAGAVCRTIRKYLLERFWKRPLDTFDGDGNLVDDSAQVYGEDLSPPVQPSPIPGRGARDTTEQVDATGAQYNAGVNLHYFEVSRHFEFVPTQAGVDTTVTQQPPDRGQ